MAALLYFGIFQHLYTGATMVSFHQGAVVGRRADAASRHQP